MDISVIYGPPGTGKTHTLIKIIEKMLEHTTPERIAFMSFTRKGVCEGRDRALKKFCQYNKNQFKYFKTIHSIVYNELGINTKQMITPDHYKRFGEYVNCKFTGHYFDDTKRATHDDKYIFLDNFYRNNPQKIDNKIKNITKFFEVRKAYYEFKLLERVIDYTDLLTMYAQTDKHIDIDYAIIDEAQDLTPLQWRVIWQAVRFAKQVIIAGDDDQSVYGWAGADVKNLYKLKCKSIILNQSYRVPKNILMLANNIAKMIKGRVKKEYQPNNNQGEIYIYNNLKDIQIDNQNEWLILARTNKALETVKNYLGNHGILYRGQDGYSISKKLMQSILAYEQIRQGKILTNKEREGMYKFLKTQETKLPWYENFKIGDVKKGYIRKYLANHKGKIDLTDYDRINVTVSTIHGAKGGEADNVVFLTDISRSSHENLHKKDTVDNELRVFYVGVTRTKNKLIFVENQNDSKYHYPIRNFLTGVPHNEKMST